MCDEMCDPQFDVVLVRAHTTHIPLLKKYIIWPIVYFFKTAEANVLLAQQYRVSEVSLHTVFLCVLVCWD